MANPSGFRHEKVRSPPFAMLFCCLLSARGKDDYLVLFLVLPLALRKRTIVHLLFPNVRGLLKEGVAK